MRILEYDIEKVTTLVEYVGRHIESAQPTPVRGDVVMTCLVIAASQVAACARGDASNHVDIVIEDACAIFEEQIRLYLAEINSQPTNHKKGH